MTTFTQHLETGRRIVQSAPELFVDIDVESDGIAGLGSLWSIGAITPFGDEYYDELVPASNEYIEANRDFIEKYGLARSALLKNGTVPKIAMQNFANWSIAMRDKYHKAGLVFCAFNASYDFPLVDLTFKQTGVENPYGHSGFCIKSLAMALHPEIYSWKNVSKKRLPSDIVPPGDMTHNALEDSRWQQPLHFALVGKLALLQAG